MSKFKREFYKKLAKGLAGVAVTSTFTALYIVAWWAGAPIPSPTDLIEIAVKYANFPEM